MNGSLWWEQSQATVGVSEIKYMLLFKFKHILLYEWYCWPPLFIGCWDIWKLAVAINVRVTLLILPSAHVRISILHGILVSQRGFWETKNGSISLSRYGCNFSCLYRVPTFHSSLNLSVFHKYEPLIIQPYDNIIKMKSMVNMLISIVASLHFSQRPVEHKLLYSNFFPAARFWILFTVYQDFPLTKRLRQQVTCPVVFSHLFVAYIISSKTSPRLELNVEVIALHWKDSKNNIQSYKNIGISGGPKEPSPRPYRIFISLSLFNHYPSSSRPE